MCVLCGEFVNRIHWTDLNRSQSGENIVVGESQKQRQQDRYRKTYLANQILTFYGLKLEDWIGSKFILRDLKGNTEVVQDIGQLWPAAEKLSKRKLDPLDPALMQFIIQNQKEDMP
ncbi:MAG: hypothetical protein WD424_09015 [Paenibacillaceae bacterium]